MGKIKKHSLKWSFVKYITPCIIASILGILIIGHGTNYLQEWYRSQYADEMEQKFKKYAVIEFSNYRLFEIEIVKQKETMIYWIISNAQAVLMPLWTLFCVWITGMIFYSRELKVPIDRLMDASRKISENQLDFKIEYNNPNELGRLCNAFDDMRQALYENNREMWHSLEERKRLNSAFSHDLRTPLTVLKGYNDFLEKYAGKVSEDKIKEILAKMNTQINRLESYTYKMSALQKLEDIVPESAKINSDALRENLAESGKYICKDKQFSIHFQSDTDKLYIDSEIVMEVYGNILSNAERYAKRYVRTYIFVMEDTLKIAVYDDGDGFSEKALQLAKEPFYRDDKEQNSLHFGLGLYICKIICEKCGGSIEISNSEDGGKVTATFFCGSR